MNSNSDDEIGDNSEEGHNDGENAPISFTNILFGNINDEGDLEDDDFLDQETRRSLRSLERLGITNTLIDELKEDVAEVNDEKSDQMETSDKESDEQKQNTKDKSSNDEHDQVADKSETENIENKKLPSAVDYSDIDEMVEDTTEPDKEPQDDIMHLPFKMPSAPVKGAVEPKSDDKDELDEDSSSDEHDGDSAVKSSSEPYKASVASPSANTDSNMSSQSKKRLDTPLAAMLPSKYENCDVTDIFPEFRHNKVLRFLRLFGLNKLSNVPAYLKDPKVSKKKKKELLRHLASHNEKETKEIEMNGEVKETDLNDKENDVKEFNLGIPTAVDPSMLAEDDEERLLRPMSPRDHSKYDESSGQDQGKPKVSDWRHGPAKLWYDMLGVPEDAVDLDAYGSDTRRSDEIPKFEQPTSDPDDAFLMVTQLQWEDDVIWDGESIKTNLDDPRMYHKIRLAGWVPSGTSRTWLDFLNNINGTRLSSMLNIDIKTHPAFTKENQRNSSSKIESQDQNKDNTWFSLLPVENEELVYAKWEDSIIWDPEIQKAVTEPKILTLDPNDENIILGIPDDVDPNATRTKEAQPIPLKEKKEHHLRKSRILLGKAGVIAEQEPESPPPPQDMKKDPFNISNDEYYNPKLTQDTALKPTVGGHLIQHSIPAVELRQPFFPTFMGPNKLRTFHRPPMKRFSHGALADALPHGVVPLLKHMKKKAKQREQERLASGGGEMFFMRSPDDLSGKDGDLILCEYSEEHPPLMMQVGMATLIKNYYKRKPGKDGGAPNFKYGELAYAHTSPFLGNLLPGQTLQALENNLFRAPIYEHGLPDTDFLILRTRNTYYIRSIDTIFTVGQELPLYEVPGPNSKKANNFIRDFLQVFIYRLFWKSNDNPRRIKMEDIKKAFPSHSESSIRKRLKLCADFKRTGNGLDSNWWVLKPDFRLPTEDEMRAMVSPEQCCSYYSMIAAEQRLKDAGYGEKSLFVADDENDEDLQLKMDDEVKAAPWNTTRAFIAAMKGKCLLQLNGVADPTGCGEGFSYIRIPNKPQMSKEDGVKEVTPKKTVTGTDADLRRLPLNQARNLLRKFGLPEDEIKKLSRWEVIDVVRTLSTEKAKAGSEQMSKFARGNRFSIAEHQERYKEECQRIFELQNRVLASYEILSTDEEESEEEDLEIEEMGKNIENIIENKKTSQQLSLEKEEEERKELRKLIMGEDSNPSEEARARKKQKTKDDDDSLSLPNKGRLLKIYRTYRNPQGREYVRIETVRKPAVIEAYVRIRETKDPEYIKKFASTLDEQQKEELRREKRRAQEQLRRLKRNEERNKGDRRGINQERNFYQDMYEGTDIMKSTSPKFKSTEPARKKIKKEKFNPKLKCSACGEVGHMKTNRACPYYKNRDSYGSSSAMGPDEVIDDDEPTGLDENELVKVDETKVVLSKSLIRHAEEERRKTMVLKIPKEAMKRRRRIGTFDHCDYLQRPEYRSANRRRTDPVVTLSTFLENICLEMRGMDGTDPFWIPVNSRAVPDYLTIIKKPMDIQTIRKKVRDKEYQNRQQFLEDVKQMHENSVLYNGKTSVLTATAQRMVELCERRFAEKDDKFASLEKAINPLLDNDQVAFSYILEKIADQLKAIPDSRDFHQPVKKTVKNYYDVIAKPMDIETLSNKARNHKYYSRDEFLSDVELIYRNSVQYNGPDSPYSLKAAEILETAREAVKAQEESLANYEKAIQVTKEAALEAADSESGGLSNQANDETNDSMPDTRPQSRAVMRDEENERMIDYFDESSRSSFTTSMKKIMERQISSDRDNEDNQQPMEMVNISLPAAEPVPAEEMVDENYDPSEFLLEKFSKRPSPPKLGSSQDHSLAGPSAEIPGPEGDDNQEDERNDDDDDIWF